MLLSSRLKARLLAALLHGAATVLLTLASMGLAGWPAPVAAIAPFQFEKQEDVKIPHWSGNVQAGLSLSGGNTSSQGVSGQGTVIRKSRHFRVMAGFDLAWTRTRVAIAHDVDGVPGIGPGELLQEERTTRQAWALRGRYDLFVSSRSSTYFSISAGGDRPSGQELLLAAQIGYGTDVIHLPHHTLRLEIGYDLAREERVIDQAIEIHSVRLFAGYNGQLDDRLTLTAQLEALTNLNDERHATPPAAHFRDTRLLASSSIKYKLNGSLSCGIRLSASYDAAPAPLPPPSGSSFQPGFTPLADRLDTTTDLVIIGVF